jgi:RNA polymerase sigma-70 factor, ECF subfamily
VRVLELSPATVPSTQAKAEFREIYEAHFDQVWHSLRRLSVAERDLMDATQNVFVVVFRKLHEFEGRAQLRTWIFQICRRVASDYRRSAPVRREVVTDSIELNARAEQLSTAPLADEQAQRVSLARAVLDKLPETQREVFILFELEQLSGEEIAAMLELPLGTVRSRLRLAREAFRREVALLVGEGPEQKAG